MKTHLSDVDVEAYRNKSASPEQLLAMNDHIFECDECFHLMDSPEKVRRTYEAFRKFLDPEPPWQEHLDYEQLESFVDGTSDADTTRQVLAHMAECEECRCDIRELKAIKEQIDAEIGRRPTAAKSHVPVAWWNMHGYRLAFALVVLFVVLAGIFWIYMNGRQSQIAKQEIRQNEEKTPNPATGATLLLKDGSRQVRLGKKGELVGLDLLPAPYVNGLKDALRTGRLPMPSAPETTLGKVGSILGPGERKAGFEVINPTSTVVEDTRPLFEWQQLPGATEYTVMIKDLMSGAESEGPAISRTSWAPHVPLIRGHQYAWMVEAVVESHRFRAPALDKPYATFKVLDEQQAAEISQARKLYGDSRLGMGLAYAKAGLLREAEREFSQVAAANPDSPLAKNLLASIRQKPDSVGR